MKPVASLLGILLVAVIVLALGGGLIVLLAAGLGWVVSLLTGLDSFPATALGLAALFVFIYLADRVVNGLMPLAPQPAPFDYEDDDFEFDEEEDDDSIDRDEEDEKTRLDKLYAGIPRWRRPTKNLDFSNVNSNDRCPCGSGRKYKNCHGAKGKAN